jgi:putative transposase
MEDEHTRECLSLDSRRKYTAVNVVDELERLVGERGRPTYLRSDNGPEFIAKEVQKWADAKGIRLVRSEPGSPWQNPFNESLNGTIRREFLERELFGSLLESKVLCVVYKWWYNNRREHSRIGNMTPKRYAETVRWTERVQPIPAIGLQQA